jgi:hypothetical protein
MRKIIFPAFFVLTVLMFHCKSSSKTQVKSETFTGKFQSVKGVMNELSCYCYDAGYLTTSDGNRIAVCFEKTTSDSINCFENLTVSGIFENVKRESSQNDPCPAGEMTILKVTEYKCK